MATDSSEIGLGESFGFFFLSQIFSLGIIFFVITLAWLLGQSDPKKAGIFMDLFFAKNIVAWPVITIVGLGTIGASQAIYSQLRRLLFPPTAAIWQWLVLFLINYTLICLALYALSLAVMALDNAWADWFLNLVTNRVIKLIPSLTIYGLGSAAMAGAIIKTRRQAQKTAP